MLKALKVKVEPIKTEDAGTITEENFELYVKTDARQDRVERLHKLTLKNCPVGILFKRPASKLIIE